VTACGCDLVCRTLYYTDLADDAKLVRCNLDGSERTVILRGLQNPNGLAVVDAEDLLYVVDSQLKHRSPRSASHGSALITLTINNDDSGANWTTTSLDKINVVTRALSQVVVI